MVKLLDHGEIFHVESWGRGLDGELEAGIIEAARMSTGKGFLGWGVVEVCNRCKGEGKCGPWGDSDRDVTEVSQCPICRGSGQGVSKPGDEKLLKFLYDNKHATPFEMAGATIEVKAPIFVFREWHRHRTQSYNEMSARYTPLPDENYIPTVERLMINSKTNKQAGVVAGAEELTVERAEGFRESLAMLYARDQDLYERALSFGVPKELARIHLPVGRYSRMRASANLRNWLAFMTLRSAPSAQYEIRVYSQALGEILTEKFPRTMALFNEGFGNK